ncbi:universal stress protein [Arenibacter sp. 6A1]|uniref:universal stress protein n=1 Tax=Arenibacter sp. 6A1 TaxID=2720391 RepID=UPI001446E82E|nr:universal stress protein [Arenibacter sp. 6A1]NKI25784.1 universal stress protein [Arenibacter sp. 6A1]
MKTILYATDYSQNSVTALHFAEALAKKSNAQMVMLHVFDMPLSLASTVSISYIKKEQRLYTEHKNKLMDFCLAQMKSETNREQLQWEVHEESSVVDGIREKAVELGADLIVVGTKGERILKEMLFGTTAEGLIKKTPCPVLAVPENSTLESLKTMVYATDFEEADIYAIRKFVQIAGLFDAQLNVVHITSQKEKNGQDQMDWFKEILQQKVVYSKLEFHLLYSENILEALIRYLIDADAGLLAMLERKDSGFFQTYFQSDLVKKMERNTPVPLLSYNVSGL